MSDSTSRILAWHRDRLYGRLRAQHFRSRALGIEKPYYVYEAPGLSQATAAPVGYLFRGHEREWVNMEEDGSRNRSTAIQDIDVRIREGLLPPMLVVMPGLNSANNHVPSLGIDMAGSWSTTLDGLGRGRFWTYLTDELLPAVADDYPQTEQGPRLMAGFSLGGYTVHLLALKRPGLFTHAAMYDGTFMWPGHQDPRTDRRGRYTDRIWGGAEIFDAALGSPRKPAAMQQWNPTDMLMAASPDALAKLRTTTYWVACASSDGRKGNLDRARFVVEQLQAHNLPLGFGDDDPIFHPAAAHTWHWADRFVVTFLQRALRQRPTSAEDVATQEGKQS